MLKKMMMLVLMAVLSTMPVAVLAEIGAVAKINSVTKVASTVKMADVTPVIRLASNDIVQLPEVSTRNIANKNVISESAVESSKIPPQAWLILTALICFVMRSSRQVV